jgi:hypothetical protein
MQSAHTHHATPEQMEACAHLCHECQDACLKLVAQCLEREHVAPEHINTLLDCVAICDASHNVLHRGSMLHTETCRACAAICEACARSCAGMGAEDDECAARCRECAASCREMSGRAG